MLDTIDVDRTVRPQDDFFRFVNGRWLATFEIPADRARYDTWTEVIVRARRDMAAVVEQSVELPAKPGSSGQLVRDLYRSLLDSARVERLGLAALAEDLAPIDAIRTQEDLVSYMGISQPIDFYARPFRAYVRTDYRDPDRSIAYVEPGRLRREPAFYLQAENEPLRRVYRAHIEHMYALAGWPRGAEVSRNVLALETRLARAMWPADRARDRVATYNRYTVARADSLTPHFGWKAFLAGAGLRTNEFVLTQPSYYAAFDSTLAEVPLEQWKDYFRCQVLSWRAGYLPQAIAQEDQDMWNRFSGQTTQSTYSRRNGAAVSVASSLSGAVERLYVEQFYPPEIGARAADVVDNLRASFGDALDRVEWMSPATKAEARRKLARLRIRFGYGSDTVDYSGLIIRAEDLVGNFRRLEQWEYRRSGAELLRPVDRKRFPGSALWPATSYFESTNEIVLTAAALQPPVFDMRSDAATMYGTFGSLVGHELGHAFDNRGRRFDAAGALRDWWTLEDETRFGGHAARLVAQYDAFVSIDGKHLDGRLTVNENIADLLGLGMAYHAYRRSLRGKEDVVLDGLTGDQRFFVGFARLWRGKARDEALRAQLTSLPHSPYEFRINGVLMNTPEFYESFGVKQGDRMYRPPADRVRIW